MISKVTDTSATTDIKDTSATMTNFEKGYSISLSLESFGRHYIQNMRMLLLIKGGQSNGLAAHGRFGRYGRYNIMGG
jgi:hypothetical protein